MQIGWLSNFFLKPLEHSNRFNGQPDIGFVRELMPHTAGVAAGRSRAQQGLTLNQDDVGDAEPRQIERDAGAHTAAADDDDVSGARRGGHYQMTFTAPDSRIGPSRVMSGRARSFAAATMSASNGSRVKRIESASSTCTALRSMG